MRQRYASRAVRRARIALAVALAGLLAMGASATLADSGPLPDAAPAGASRPLARGVASYVVNTTDDVDDGTCDFAHCSLREALELAAYEQGPHVITFEIPTLDPGYDSVTGVWTIQPATGFDLPFDVTIDGYVGSAPGRGLHRARCPRSRECPARPPEGQPWHQVWRQALRHEKRFCWKRRSLWAPACGSASRPVPPSLPLPRRERCGGSTPRRSGARGAPPTRRRRPNPS